MIASPDTIADRVGQNTANLRSHAPRLADAMTDTTLAGLGLLRDKMPPMPPGDPLDPHARIPLPPPGVREQWLRYHDAVEHPMGVVDSLRDGRLNPEGVEVLQTVYPSLYAKVQQITYEQMATGKLKDLTHQQRIGLGLMLQLPSDPTLDPAYIAARQSAFSSTAPDDTQQGPKSQKPRKSVNLSKGVPSLASERIEGPSNG